jgi:hypothetical protein
LRFSTTSVCSLICPSIFFLTTLKSSLINLALARPPPKRRKIHSPYSHVYRSICWVGG